MIELGVWVGFAILAFALETFCCAAAYRIHKGPKGLDIPFAELMLRSVYVAAFFSLIGWSGFLISRQLDLGYNGYLLAGIVLIPLAAQIINWIFGLDSWPAGLGIYFLRLIPLLAAAITLVVFGLLPRF